MANNTLQSPEYNTPQNEMVFERSNLVAMAVGLALAATEAATEGVSE